MKKLLFGLLICIFMIPGVKADTAILTVNDISDFTINKELYDTQTEMFIDYYNTNFKEDYQYYFIVKYSQESSEERLSLFVTNSIEFNSLVGSEDVSYGFYADSCKVYYIDNDVITKYRYGANYNYSFFNVTNDYSFSEFYFRIYDSNFPLLYTQLLIQENISDYNFNTLEIANFYSDSSIVINDGGNIPVLKDLLNYNSFADYDAFIKGYTEVNLDNYEYVILSLKDYSQSDAFETNLQVKGSIGITPVYEYGTVEKEEITDLCNTNYSDFTDYRFFILKNDLINNAVYIVKDCNDSGTSFRFDSTIFNITYVTTENVDDPVVTIGGTDYHTIPFNKLTNTVNKNEEEGFIPGESGSSLTDIIDNITDYISSFWNSLSTFMGLVTKFFNTLPIEIRAITITTFTTACTLGLLKILKS